MHDQLNALKLEVEEAVAKAKTAAELEPQVVAAVRAGDVIMVKASAGSRMGPIVKALVQRHSFATAPEPVRVQG